MVKRIFFFGIYNTICNVFKFQIEVYYLKLIKDKNYCVIYNLKECSDAKSRRYKSNFLQEQHQLYLSLYYLSFYLLVNPNSFWLILQHLYYFNTILIRKNGSKVKLQLYLTIKSYNIKKNTYKLVVKISFINKIKFLQLFPIIYNQLKT